MCRSILVRVWQGANNVQELKSLIGGDIVFNASYQNQEIKPEQCLCCVDIEATAKLHGYGLEIVADEYWFKRPGIDRE